MPKAKTARTEPPIGPATHVESHLCSLAAPST
jgi:hypothetical protein